MTTKISGTEGVDLIKDGTVKQADLAANVAGNGPVIRIPLGAFSWGGPSTKTVLNTPEYNFGFTFDSPNRRFIAQVAGYYQVNWRAQNQTGTITAALFRNGVVCAYGTAGLNASVGADIVYLQAGDYLELWLTTTTSGDVTVGSAISFIDAALVRSAP